MRKLRVSIVAVEIRVKVKKALFCIIAYTYWVFKTLDLIYMYIILKEKERQTKKKYYENSIKPDYIWSIDNTRKYIKLNTFERKYVHRYQNH